MGLPSWELISRSVWTSQIQIVFTQHTTDPVNTAPGACLLYAPGAVYFTDMVLEHIEHIIFFKIINGPGPYGPGLIMVLDRKSRPRSQKKEKHKKRWHKPSILYLFYIDFYANQCSRVLGDNLSISQEKWCDLVCFGAITFLFKVINSQCMPSCLLSLNHLHYPVSFFSFKGEQYP